MALRLTPNLAARGRWLMPAAASCRINRTWCQVPGTAAFIEIVQYAPGDPDAVTGALGLAITGD